MIKKAVLILVGVILAVGVLGAAGYAYAQSEDPPEIDTAADGDKDVFPGFMGKGGGGWFGLGEGVLSDYILPEIAKIFGLSADQAAAFENVQETMQGIKDSYTLDEIQEMMKAAFTAAVDAAVADGAITQDEADQMLERNQQFNGRDFGRSGGRGMRGGFSGFDFQGRGLDRGFSGPAMGDRSDGVMGEYMQASLASAMGLSVEEFQAMKAEEGFNIKDYAVEQDMTVEELQDWMVSVYTDAINAALEDGAITQDQADQMLSQLENFDGRLPFEQKFPGRGHGW